MSSKKIIRKTKKKKIISIINYTSVSKHKTDKMNYWEKDDEILNL